MSFVRLALMVVLCGWSSIAAAGSYFDVTYEPSTEPGELSLGVTYTIWIPESSAPLRGVIVHQHGCGTGACQGGATAAYDLHWQALATKWNCALLGPSYHQKDGENCRLWCDPRNGSHKTLLRALDDFSAQAKRPELKTVPWCLWGHSGGAFWASLMQTMYPERIVAIWFRSGGAFPYWERGEIEKPEITPAVLAIPMMQNPGAKEKDHERFKIAYDGGLAMFESYRKQGAPIGFAPDPRTAHECGDSRYLAIPFFDVCLDLRLPPPGSTSPTLRPINLARGRLVAKPELSTEPSWLPNDRLSRLYDEYLKTGFVEDSTPPAAPQNLKVSRDENGVVTITWSADADFESGLGGFIVERNGETIVQLPEKPIAKFGKPLFQAMSYHDTPEKPLPEMKYEDKQAAGGKSPRYRVIAVNAAGVKSEPSAEAMIAP
jgi:hypothetical protein